MYSTCTFRISKNYLYRIDKAGEGLRGGAKRRGELLIEVHGLDVQVGEHVLAVAHVPLASLTARAQNHSVEAVLDVHRA